MPRFVGVRPPWLAATCLLGATIALVPPKHGLDLAPMGPRPTVIVFGERIGDGPVDPWMIITPPELDAAIVHTPDWHGDPRIFLNAPPVYHSTPGLDDLLSGLWKLVAPVPG
jgi:hypothetical protein